MAPPRAPKTAAKMLEKLAEHFDVEDHKTNPRGYTYIAIEKVVNRFNEVLGENWDVKVENLSVNMAPGLTYGRQSKAAGFATVVVTIEALLDGRLVARSGVGGDFGAIDDVDKLVKTAYAEAIKKAGHEFGVGLYLWDEEERALIEAAQAAGMTGQVVAAPAAPAVGAGNAISAAVDGAVVSAALPVVAASAADLDALKNKVADLAVLAGVQRTGPAIAAHFGIPVESLQDEGILRGIIEANIAAA